MKKMFYIIIRKLQNKATRYHSIPYSHTYQNG